jgi:predicted ABC-type ATPase
VPTLTVLAGPNGAGKSYFSKFFLERGWITVTPVNIDALENFVDTTRLPHDCMRYGKVLETEVNNVFNQLVESAIQNKKDFAFECNLRVNQLKCVNCFDRAGYNIDIIYICLDSIELSKDRVQIRINEGGHFVGDNSIKENFKQGLANLDESIAGPDPCWNHLFLIDNSKDLKGKGDVLTLLLEMEGQKVVQVSDFYRKKEWNMLLPEVCAFLEKQITPLVG